MDSMTSLAMNTGNKRLGQVLSKVDGIEDKYKSLASRSSNGTPLTSPEEQGLVVTGWKGLSPVKKGIVVAFYHMANPDSYNTVDFSDIADKNEIIVVNQWRMEDKFGAGAVIEMALKKASIPFKIRKRS